ncbi:uncharacterized protein CDAR_432781 [Caerostris darwini]|uniref:Uncharacterized protein n=1 Tax=Caerostris darwini TaxID=1538125 RepID=A0AAV4QM62_9ARAC|nr:uncharacterized protein CDAR_432781 [Caerostris darwini]
MASDKGLQTKFDLQCKTAGAAEGKLPIPSIIKWLKETGVVSKDTGITDSEVEATCTKTAKDKKSMDFAEFKECLNAIAKEKKLEPKDLLNKLASE